MPKCPECDLEMTPVLHKTWQCSCGIICRRVPQLQLYHEMLATYDQWLIKTDMPNEKKLIQKRLAQIKKKIKKCDAAEELEEWGINNVFLKRKNYEYQN